MTLSSIFYLSSQGNYGREGESLSIGLAPNEVNSLVYIAENQQYFASNGLNVAIKNYVSGLAAINGMLNGEVDIASASEFVFVTKAYANENIRALGSIDKFFNEYLVARKDRGINAVSDLRGKTIGVAIGTSAEFYLGIFLELNEMDLRQVTLVDIPPPQSPNALTNGTVDAVITWEPYVSAIKSLLGDENVMWRAQGDMLTYMVASCTNSWATTHPVIVTRFLKSVEQAEEYLISNLNKAKTIISNKLNYSEEYIATIWPEHHFSLSLDQSLISAMENEARWIITNNLTDQTSIPNFLNYLYLEGLSSVKPDSVNVIR